MIAYQDRWSSNRVGQAPARQPEWLWGWYRVSLLDLIAAVLWKVSRLRLNKMLVYWENIVPVLVVSSAASADVPLAGRRLHHRVHPRRDATTRALTCNKKSQLQYSHLLYKHFPGIWFCSHIFVTQISFELRYRIRSTRFL